METRTRELAGSAIVITIGGFLSIYALWRLDVGTFARMGPGMFPLLCGIIMTLLGLWQGATAIRLDNRLHPTVEWRAFAFVTGACVLFAFLIELVGLLPTIFATVICAGFANSENRLRTMIILAGVLAIIAVAIFKWMLGTTLTLVEGII